jgi:hypothetical protein
MCKAFIKQASPVTPSGKTIITQPVPWESMVPEKTRPPLTPERIKAISKAYWDYVMGRTGEEKA